jgi:uncharacterized membrane protein YhfC
MSSSGLGQVLLEESGQLGPEPASKHCPLTLDVPKHTRALEYSVHVDLTEGRAGVRLTDSAGEKRAEFSTGGSLQISRRVRTWGQTGTWKLEVVPEKAVGTWSVRVVTKSETVPIVLFLAPGLGMVFVGGAAVLWWRWQSQAKWRWFWVGAAVWFVGVVLKVVFSILLNQPILKAIDSFVPHTSYLLLGGLYVGLLTGIFEIGVTLVAALIWRRMADDAARGFAVGVGAGAFEAILLGFGVLLTSAVAITMGGPLRDRIAADVDIAANVTRLWWLGPSVERVIAIACHTSSRALVLWGVARGKWFWPFAAGFTIMTAIDAVAGYVHLAGLLGKVSLWWIELAVAPAAVLSIPLLIWCYRTWPLSRQGNSDCMRDTQKDQ